MLVYFIFFGEMTVCAYISHIVGIWQFGLVYETLKGSAHSPRAHESSVFFCPSLRAADTFLPLGGSRCNTHFKHAS